MGAALCGEEGHQIPLIKAAEPGAVQPREELTWGPVVASTLCWVLKSRDYRGVCFIPEGKARTGMGSWGRGTIRWPGSAKKEPFFKNQDYSERERRGGRPFIPGEV